MNEPPSPALKPCISKLAITSFVMGLVSLTCVLWPLLGLPAIVCGIIALVKISGSGGQLAGKGYAITGIVIPSVMTLLVPVLGILLAIMFPAINQARNKALNLVCANNERQLVLALINYSQDSDGKLPEENWMDVIQEKGLIQDKNTLTCIDAESMAVSYVLNKHIKNINEVKNPARTVLIFEGDSDIDGLGGPDDIAFPHRQEENEGCNIGFVDGHTELVTSDRVKELLWFPDQE